MAEEIKSYDIKKTTVGTVYFEISNINDNGVTRVIKLTDAKPQIRLPRDWALGLFNDESTLNLLNTGVISFTNNAAAYKDALDSGYFFGDVNSIPKESLSVNEYLTALKNNDQGSLYKGLKTDKGRTEITSLIADHRDEIPSGAITYVEKILGVSLTVAEE